MIHNKIVVCKANESEAITGSWKTVLNTGLSSQQSRPNHPHPHSGMDFRGGSY